MNKNEHDTSNEDLTKAQNEGKNNHKQNNNDDNLSDEKEHLIQSGHNKTLGNALKRNFDCLLLLLFAC